MFCVQYTRMDTETFDRLVSRLTPDLQKRHVNTRNSLTVEEQVVICLRFLSTGDSYRTIAFNFRIGVSTVHYAVLRVCNAIWNVLHEEQLPVPTTDMWLASANKFELLWNFPHCVAAVDGKHIVMQAPANSGSAFYNYKGNFSIVLLAVVDTEYRFIAIDIGQYGSSSDGGVFNHSAIGEALHKSKLFLPNSAHISNAPELGQIPYFLVGDEAFPLETYLLRPFPGRGLPTDRRIFNYRLSRARRVVEQAFGILTARWRIYHRRLPLQPDNVQRLVKATVILHNMLQRCKPFMPNEETASASLNLQPVLSMCAGRGTNQPKTAAIQVRETLKDYFVSAAGSVEWQIRAVNEGW